MAKMWRVTTEGVISQCDDTPDEDKTNVKYQRSSMRVDQWIYIHWVDGDGWRRWYKDKSEVPKLVKMMDLLDP